jgi:hypothetical protein
MARRCRRRACCTVVILALVLATALLLVVVPEAGVRGVVVTSAQHGFDGLAAWRGRASRLLGEHLTGISNMRHNVTVSSSSKSAAAATSGAEATARGAGALLDAEDATFEMLTQARVRTAREGRSTVASLGGRKHPASCGFLVAVLSARENVRRRERVRQWARSFERASLRVHGGPPSRVVFIVGDTAAVGDGTLGLRERALSAEQAKHQDLLVVDAVDEYHNSAAKMLSFYQLLHDISLDIKDGLIKMDDDAIMIPDKFFAALYLSPCAQRSTDGEVCEQPGRPSHALSALRSGAFIWWGHFRVNEGVQRGAHDGRPVPPTDTHACSLFL